MRILILWMAVLIAALLAAPVSAQVSVQRMLGQEISFEEGPGQLTVRYVFTNFREDSITGIELVERFPADRFRSITNCNGCEPGTLDISGSEAAARIIVEDLLPGATVEVSYVARLKPGNYKVHLGETRYTAAGGRQHRRGADHVVTVRRKPLPLVWILLLLAALGLLFLLRKQGLLQKLL